MEHKKSLSKFGNYITRPSQTKLRAFTGHPKTSKYSRFYEIADHNLRFFSAQFSALTDTGEDSKLVHRRKRPKVDTLFSTLFFPTRPNDE